MTWATRFRRRESLRESLWLVPIVGAVLGGILGVAVAVADEGTVADGSTVVEEDTVEDEDASNWWPRAAAIAAMTTSRPATRILGIRRVVVRAGWL